VEVSLLGVHAGDVKGKDSVVTVEGSVCNGRIGKQGQVRLGKPKVSALDGEEIEVGH
jgi:hypothetical protein